MNRINNEPMPAKMMQTSQLATGREEDALNSPMYHQACRMRFSHVLPHQISLEMRPITHFLYKVALIAIVMGFLGYLRL